MSVLEALSEEEAYLWAILSDPSGLDLAEFCFRDEEQGSGCWRAWPYQWAWFRNGAQRQIDQCARSVGKSMSIKIRAFAFPFLHPGQEMVITAPELNHLSPITGLVENLFHTIRLGRLMLPRGQYAGTTHRPFQMDFLNGSRILGRIPQKDGKGVKGIHPIWLELDEAQDYPKAGWTELRETVKRGSEGSMWRAHGVTRGVRDDFFVVTQPNSGWTVHRYTAMHRPYPHWSDLEREQKMEEYGSRDHPDYRRNVLGEHGDSTSPLFVLHRLMQCCDENLSSNYNEVEYNHLRINHEMLQDRGGDIADFLDFPQSHKKYKRYWAGMDVGYTNHPSEILVFAESEYKNEKPVLKLLTRVHLERISHPDQVEAIKFIIDWYKPVAFSLDKTGVGLPLFQQVQQENQKKYLDIIRGYGYSEKILVDFDDSKKEDEHALPDEVAKEAGIYRNVVEYASDVLRDMVDNKRIILPWDRDLIGEFQGQTYTVVRDSQNIYGRKEYNKGKFHALDAARMAVLGMAQTPIEQFMATKPEAKKPVVDIFLEF
jgi:hypothetical protein